jgi:murein DD-endopeptidase MepM/ murein hydrolase activator NlpD
LTLGLTLIVCLLALPAPVQPVVRLELRPERVRQGESIVVWVHAAGTASATLTVRGRSVPLYGDSSGWVTLVGTDANTPGRIWITATVRTRDERVVQTSASLRVMQRRFGRRYLKLAPRTRALLSAENIALERRLVREAERRSAPVRYWQGAFTLPVRGRVTSGYGVRSVYNGVPGGFHGGVDFAAPKGTPVRASQPGRVILARPLPLSGLFVMLDHGQGLLTTYHHLSAIGVTEGAWVQRGQRIGAVGSTGLSTGPHLHWGMRLHGVRINPLPWTTRPGP